MFQLRCAMLDAKILDNTFSEHDAKSYVAFSSSLARTHLDHDPSNNRQRNLKSLCQRCHMTIARIIWRNDG